MRHVLGFIFGFIVARVAIVVVLIVVGLVAGFLAVGCGSSASTGGSGTPAAHTAPRKDGWGDPFITDAQGRSIRVGESESAALRALGGKAVSGEGSGVVPEGLDYPIRGTGAEPETDEATKWWKICLENGRVVGTMRSASGSLWICTAIQRATETKGK